MATLEKLSARNALRCVWCKKRRDEHRFSGLACPLKDGEWGRRSFRRGKKGGSMEMFDRERIARWLQDGRTWVGVFEKGTLRVAVPFDAKACPVEWVTVGRTRAPLMYAIDGRYVLVAICRTLDEVQEALMGVQDA